MKRIAGIPLIILGNAISQIINFFKNRVLADGATIEAESCMESEIVRLRNLGLWDKASLVVTPNGYKAGKIYSLKPNNGSGDMVFSRASSRTRRNASGIVESLANNVPGVDYPVGGGCPAGLYEPQKTNLMLWSEDLTQASWSKTGGAVITANNVVAPDGNMTADRINGGVVFQNATVVSGSIYRASVWLRADTNGTVVFGNAAGSVFITINVTTSWQRFEYSRITNSTSDGIAVYCNTGTLSQVYMWGAQYELGAFATSYIPTTNATATRIGDTIPALNNSALFGASSCTWFIHVVNNIAVNNDGTHVAGPYISNGTQGLYLATTTSGRLRLWTAAAGTVFQTTADEVKLAVVCNGTTVDVFQNGVKVVTGFSYAFAFNRIGIAAPNIPLHLRDNMLVAQRITDAECVALTTL